MNYTGSCHCGNIRFSVEADIDQAIDCNCSHCSRKGYLLSFVSRDQLTVETPRIEPATYLFNTHKIQHRFCPVCGCAPFGEGADPAGRAMAAINIRCIENIDLAAVTRVPVDGRAR
jgi:hypothetical protein